MYRYDFHVHTAERSACGRSPAEEMCRAALASGLSGIALTDHDVWWPMEDLAHLRANFPDLVILAGAEVALGDNHFLVFVPERRFDLPFDGDPAALTREVHAAGGLVIWAHPFRYDPDVPDWLGRAALDGIEVDSSNMNGETSARSAAMARRQGLFPFRNSDAHHASTLGRYGNALDCLVRDEREMVQAVRGRVPAGR